MPAGRPTKYKPEYCQQMIEYFDIEPEIEVEVTKYTKDGDAYQVTETRPCQCPTFERFCANIAVSRNTFHAWVKEHKEFQDAYHISKNSQAHIMMVNGMSGAFNAAFTNLSMKNMHGWSDKQEIENTHNVVQMPPVQLNGEEIGFDIGEDVKQIGQDDDN